jgi:hypothetical protein
VVVLATLIPASLVAPMFADDWKLDGAVRAVALDWRDFGEEEARVRMQYELDHRRIGLQVSDDDCALTETATERTVRCAWDVDVHVPLVGVDIPLAFSSEATVTPDGDVR